MSIATHQFAGPFTAHTRRRAPAAIATSRRNVDLLILILVLVTVLLIGAQGGVLG